MKCVPEGAKVALIGIIFCPNTAWIVQDNRKGKEFPCRTKADVLNRLAIILDDIHNPPNKLDQENDPVEITVAVRLQVSLCEPGDQINILDLRRAASEAVENAVRHNQGDGFNHALADKLSLAVREVRAFGVE